MIKSTGLLYEGLVITKMQSAPTPCSGIAKMDAFVYKAPSY